MRSEKTKKLQGKELADRLDALHNKLSKDSDYGALCSEYLDQSARLLQALDKMTEEQRDAVVDYLGCLSEMHGRTLSAALDLWEKPVN